jgi:redox-sensitive bicupin YhaK (pirin superfamily)
VRHRLDDGLQSSSQRGQRVLNLGRHLKIDSPVHDAISFQFSQLLRQHLLCDAGHRTQEVGEAQRAMLWGGRLKPDESMQVPDAPYVHLFIAKGKAELEGAGPLETGDAVRLAAAGARRLIADAGTEAEVLVWETNQDLDV